MVAGAAIAAETPVLDPVLAERMSKEKDARKACEVELCKAFLKPEAGAPIACDVTKTWPKDEILAKIVGGSYVWGYGHMQCSVKLTIDRNAFDKAAAGPNAVVKIADQKLTCNVDDKDPAKGLAFKADVNVTPQLTFEKGKAKAVSFGAAKTEGSTVASAAVTSLLAADSVSGIVSRAASAEANNFFYVKCKEIGIEIPAQP